MAEERQSPKDQWFSPTSWSGIEAIQAGTAGAKEALERICQAYWYPLYAFVRRSGYNQHDAEDLTQGFFTSLLEKNLLQAVDRSKGKFRSFLLAAIKYHILNTRAGQAARKRGGGKSIVSLDELRAEERFSQEPLTHLSPDKVYEKQWCLTVLERVKARLRAEYEKENKLERFLELELFLTEETVTHGYDDIADRLNTSANTVAAAVHRMRHRYRELLREEIAGTVADPTELDSEIQHFYDSLSPND